MIIRRQNRFLGAFRAAGAVSPASARTLDELGVRETWIFRRMVERGVFQQSADGRWYLDEPAAGTFIRHRRRRILVFLAIAIVVMVLVLILALR